MDMSKYKFYTNDENTVVAVSSYAGKPVRGIAKCDPRDEFNLANGKELAAARCNVKIAEKRKTRAYKKYHEAISRWNDAQKETTKMVQYFTNAAQAYEKACEDLNRIKESL